MSTRLENMKERLHEIHKGLFQLSRDRKVALPPHSAFELVDELEEKVDLLMKQIEELEQDVPEVSRKSDKGQKGRGLH